MVECDRFDPYSKNDKSSSGAYPFDRTRSCFCRRDALSVHRREAICISSHVALFPAMVAYISVVMASLQFPTQQTFFAIAIPRLHIEFEHSTEIA